ncbi:Transmembrane 9 superfamily member 11 [Camellia lanceoleosa]|uniref:Transmembrane 9 superfamily member 11 n=1 Tax=Camellia lanceoleosa TaxID=1840588 RepID=A0ACC0HC58_9ERIC|nr:Transmembrane 9 superfamily member 11 [Camellia lanceoleosa]
MELFVGLILHMIVPASFVFFIVSEQFRVVREPPEFGLHEEFLDHIRVGVLRDCLSVCDFFSPVRIDIWLMKDYGIKESWSKELVIESGIGMSGNWGSYEPIMMLKSGEFLMLVNKDVLMSYNPKLGSFKKLNIYGIKSEFYGIAHIPSFVSLKDVAKGESLMYEKPNVARVMGTRDAVVMIPTNKKSESEEPGYVVVGFEVIPCSFQHNIESLKNLKIEQFRVVPEPPEFGLHKEFHDHIYVGVLQDCLSICDFFSPLCIDIWLMKDYGIKESWSKELVIENGIVKRGHLCSYEPIIILKSGKVLMLVNKDALMLYNPRLGSFKMLNIYGIKSEFYGIAYIPSFVSLKDVAKGERLTRGGVILKRKKWVNSGALALANGMENLIQSLKTQSRAITVNHVIVISKVSIGDCVAKLYTLSGIDPSDPLIQYGVSLMDIVVNREMLMSIPTDEGIIGWLKAKKEHGGGKSLLAALLRSHGLCF